MTWLLSGRFGIRFSAEIRDFFSQKRPAGSVVYEPSIECVPDILSSRVNRSGLELFTDLYLVLRLRMSKLRPVVLLWCVLLACTRRAIPVRRCFSLSSLSDGLRIGVIEVGVKCANIYFINDLRWLI